jgi:hypothetical protein
MSSADLTPAQWISIAVSVAALGFSIASFVANYRLARWVAERSGRLQQVRLVARDLEDGGGFNLVLANGPDDLTIAELKLRMLFQLPNDGSLKARRVSVLIFPRDFSLLGITGPELPCRIKAYDQQVWHLPSTGGMVEGALAEYCWEGRTSTGEKFASRKLRIGLFDRGSWFHSTRVFDAPITEQDLREMINRYPLLIDLFDRHKAGQLDTAQ